MYTFKSVSNASPSTSTVSTMTRTEILEYVATDLSGTFHSYARGLRCRMPTALLLPNGDTQYMPQFNLKVTTPAVLDAALSEMVSQYVLDGTDMGISLAFTIDKFNHNSNRVDRLFSNLPVKDDTAMSDDLAALLDTVVAPVHTAPDLDLKNAGVIKVYLLTSATSYEQLAWQYVPMAKANILPVAAKLCEENQAHIELCLSAAIEARLSELSK